MKDYMFLRWSQFNKYRYISDYVSSSNLRFLIDFLSNDYRSWDKDFLTQTINCYNANFIYHDFTKKILYIGCSEWSLSDGEMQCPDEEEFPNYVNETNSCKINVDNYLEFTQNWIEIKKTLLPFAIIYRDDLDWIHCKSFNTQAEMELFVKVYQPEIAH